ncbi:SREBP regulating gene protein isoform X1 [Hydra vulgaris]|uniref:SREBP regulating gene protein isoform X1 n=1 Tax=Hydra vulgaris TaxID=6087 RepID=UPI001F5EFD9C|nr:SREBP regulating gene protein [Hydra vulgaris]
MQTVISGGFWRRWIILLSFLATVICVLILFQKTLKDQGSTQSFMAKFTWLDLSNATFLKKCRNSKQGPYLIADEKGQVCMINNVLKNGCCNFHANSTVRYNCNSCHTNRCCEVYEHCVSCCLQPVPRKRRLIEKILVHAHMARNPLLREVKDTFELCLHKCRTSSASVYQENKYKDSSFKYCFGTDSPDLV